MRGRGAWLMRRWGLCVLFAVVLAVLVHQLSRHFSRKADELLFAAEVGRLEDVRKLLDIYPWLAGTEYGGGITPLHKAAEHGHTDVAELLLQHDPNVDARNMLGWTPLHAAVMRGNSAVVELLLAHGADVNAKAWPFPMELIPPPWEMTGREARNITAEDLNLSSWDTPVLHFAIQGREKEIAELLLANGAKVDAMDARGQRSMHHAVRQDVSGEWVRLLLANGADVNVTDNLGRTPLHVAVETAHRRAADVLLANGADIRIRDNEGRTPLQLAVEVDHHEIVELLKKHGPKE